jgi:hypothetical protein
MMKMAAIILSVMFLNGCSSLQNMRDPLLTEGCAVVEVDAKLGWLNQEGAAEVCKIKCSKEIPENLEINYENSRSGCSIRMNRIGTST